MNIEWRLVRVGNGEARSFEMLKSALRLCVLLPLS